MIFQQTSTSPLHLLSDLALFNIAKKHQDQNVSIRNFVQYQQGNATRIIKKGVGLVPCKVRTSCRVQELETNGINLPGIELWSTAGKWKPRRSTHGETLGSWNECWGMSYRSFHMTGYGKETCFVMATEYPTFLATSSYTISTLLPAAANNGNESWGETMKLPFIQVPRDRVLKIIISPEALKTTTRSHVFSAMTPLLWNADALPLHL